MYVCMYVCEYVCMYVLIPVDTALMPECKSVIMDCNHAVSMYVCMYVCVCMYICVYVDY